MAPVQSSALPSPLQVSKHPKNVIEDKIKKMKEKHKQRNVPDPDYEEVFSFLPLLDIDKPFVYIQ